MSNGTKREPITQQKIREEMEKMLAVDDAVIAEMQKSEEAKKTLKQRIKFWLTCWIPVTRYTLSKRDAAFVRLSYGVVNIHKMQARTIGEVNSIALHMQGEAFVKEAKKAESLKDDVQYQ